LEELTSRVRATLRPRITHDLRPSALAFVGRRTVWYPGWVIEGGLYDGQWAMIPTDPSAGFGWSPLCDLAEAKELNRV